MWVGEADLLVVELGFWEKNVSVLSYNVYNKHFSSIKIILDNESGLKLLVFGIWLPFDALLKWTQLTQ